MTSASGTNAFRQPIDVRVKSLSMTCRGFKQQPDYSHGACRAYHRLVNERNNLLHGNVVIDKLKFNEVYFLGTIPVFKEYRTAWERSLQIEADAVGLESLQNELNVVRSFTEYLLSCLDDGGREQESMIVERHELALNDSGRIGILFPEWLVDFRAGGVLSDDTPSPPAEERPQTLANHHSIRGRRLSDANRADAISRGSRRTGLGIPMSSGGDSANRTLAGFGEFRAAAWSH